MIWIGRIATVTKVQWKDLAAMIACYWLVIVCLPLMVLGFAWVNGCQL